MLSKKTKYGLKAIIYIAKYNKSNVVSIREISQKEKISQKFLEGILLTLRKSGFLGSKKGKNGGYYLIRPPDSIKMTEIIRILEGPIALVPCVSLNYYEKCDDCPDENTCSIRKLMIEVRDSNLNIFNNKSLADLIS